MAQLTNEKIQYLLKYWKRFLERTTIIDTMTLVGNRPSFELFSSEFPTEQNKLVIVDYAKMPDDARYEPPYTLEQIKQTHGEAVYQKLVNDPIHKWRAQTGIELIHRDTDLFQFLRIYRNWLLLPEQQKKKSDEKSVELFGIPNRQHFFEILPLYFKKVDGTPLEHQGDVIELIDVVKDRSCLAYLSKCEISKQHCELQFKYIGSGQTRLMNQIDQFTLPKNTLKCNKEDVNTTVGRFLLNVLLIELPFHGMIPYDNEPGFNLDNVQKQISHALFRKEIAIEDYKKFIDNIYYIGHFTELCVPNFTRASLHTSPDMKDLKSKLLSQYAGRMDDPKAIAQIEDILIKADKEYLKNDESMRFYAPLGAKPFNIARKKMYLTVGGIEAFSKNSGAYTFINNALADGWSIDAIPSIANEIRKGSYNRGHETQLGGAETKYIMRVFQDFCIVQDDCNTDTGLSIDFSKYDPGKYIGRYLRVNGKWVAITDENKDTFKDKSYIMRSPMYCKSQHGLCKKCAGDKFAALNVKHIAMYIVDISSTFTTMSLKLMHGSKLELYELKDLNQFLI